MLNNVGKTLPLITCLYELCFYNAGFISSNNGPFTIKDMQLRGKAQLLIIWTSQGSSWTLGPFGNLDSVDFLDLWISWEELGLLAIFFGSSMGEILDS